VRMRRHVQASPAVSIRWPVVIDEAPGSDAAPGPQRQQTAHSQVADLRVPGRRYLVIIFPGNGDVFDLGVGFDGAHLRGTPFGHQN
jgi:hypothetical protein